VGSGTNIVDIAAVVICLTAACSYINYRWLRLPQVVGIMLLALLLSVSVAGLGIVMPSIRGAFQNWVGQIEFDQTLMHGMLSFLLFAGALRVNLEDLLSRKYTIGFLATFGVMLSTVLVGSGMYFVARWLELGLSYKSCLLFGALISPTDPIAVLGLLRSVGAPKSLEIKITGESLFNDGVGVVVFLILLEAVTGEKPLALTHAGWLFVEEALGGVAFGWLVGWLAYRALRSVDHYPVEALITLALVLGGYTLAGVLHVSGPIAMVVAGLLIGNHGRQFAMSVQTREHLDTFWELVDEILNAVLFLLIGLEILVIPFSRSLIGAGLAAIPIVLTARWISTAIPILVLRRWRRLTPGAIPILTWGGLRGGISIALALSLPIGELRDRLVGMTYLVVLFSVLVQGLTLRAVAQRVLGDRIKRRQAFIATYPQREHSTPHPNE